MRDSPFGIVCGDRRHIVWPNDWAENGLIYFAPFNDNGNQHHKYRRDMKRQMKYKGPSKNVTRRIRMEHR